MSETTALLLRGSNRGGSPVVLGPRRTAPAHVFDLDAYLLENDDDNNNADGSSSVDLTVPIFAFVPPWLVMTLLSLLVASLVLAIRAERDPVYTLSPFDCSAPELYVNATSWYLDKWHILYGRGACPIGASGLKTVYTKHGNDITQETFWTWGECFSDWAGLDARNGLHGYSSRLAATEWRWVAANRCELAAVMVLFLTIFLLVVLFLLAEVADADGSGARGEVGLFGLTVAVTLLCGFVALEVVASAMVRHVPHADPRAWSTSFFASCQVDVRVNDGYTYAVCSAWLGGAVLATCAASGVHAAYCKPPGGPPAGGRPDGDTNAPRKRLQQQQRVASTSAAPTALRKH